jgi:hypothetical protein
MTYPGISGPGIPCLSPEGHAWIAMPAKRVYGLVYSPRVGDVPASEKA